MKLEPLVVAYSELYLNDYETASCENPERIRNVIAELREHYPIEKPTSATDHEILMVHSHALLNDVKRDSYLFETAAMAAGGAIMAGQYAYEGRPTFAAVRPPGHHAGPSGNWGFCFFNNVAISIEKLIRQNKVKQALILDIDLHFGDGTDDYFENRREVTVANIQDDDRSNFLKNVDRALSRNDFDIVAISAGFDRHRQDWGGTLTTEDYYTIGKNVRDYCVEQCEGRFFAVLEGGYNTAVLGQNTLALCRGMDGEPYGA